MFRTLRSPEAWAVALGFGLVVVARWSAVGSPPSARSFVGGVLAVIVPAVVVGACNVRGRHLTAAAVALACGSTVLAAAADGRWQGALALAMVALAAGSVQREIAGVAALVAAVGVASWWRAGFDRGDAPGPSWREVVGETGSLVRRSLSSVGTAELPVPASGALLWWLACGLVVGGALVAGRPARAAWVPLSIAGLVAVAWAIRAWRGSVDPVGGTWIVVSGLVLAAGGGGGGGGERRTAAVVALLAGLVTAVAFVREVRADGTPAVIAVVIGAALVGGVLAAGAVRPRISAPGDA